MPRLSLALLAVIATAFMWLPGSPAQATRAPAVACAIETTTVTEAGLITETACVEMAQLSVQWEAIYSPLDPNPNAGGGQRIFPDLQSPSDMRHRNFVRVKALVQPAKADLTVFFKSFDVDDPSSNAAPVDGNDGAGATGQDNRGSVEGKKEGKLSESAQTDASGVAHVVLAVTMHPGDNFRVAASLDNTKLAAVTQAQVDANTPPEGVAFTDMLTVWRRLHLERDSMAAPDAANTVSGNIVKVVGPVAGQCTVTIDKQLKDDNQYEKVPAEGNPAGRGDLTVGGKNYPVVANDTAANSVVTVGAVGGACPPESGPPPDSGPPPPVAYTLHDDDDDTLLDSQPDISLMAAGFAPAYVRPVVLSDANDNADFDKNTKDAEVRAATYGSYGKWDTKKQNANNYWVSYLLTVFQADRSCDNDPEVEACDLGFTTTLAAYGPISGVYREDYDDRCIRGGTKNTGEGSTWLHEVGHLFAGANLHGDGGVGTKGCNKPALDFTAATLARIRDALRPG